MKPKPGIIRNAFYPTISWTGALNQEETDQSNGQLKTMGGNLFHRQTNNIEASE